MHLRVRVHLHQRLHTEGARGRRQGREPRGREDRHDEEDRVGPVGARLCAGK